MQSLHQFDWSVRDIEFLLWEQFRIDEQLLRHEAIAGAGIDRELLVNLLHQARQFSARELDPINMIADQEGCLLDAEGRVHVPSVFTEAWAKYRQAGWTELAKPVHERIGLPQVACQAYLELMFGACPAFMTYGGFGTPIAHMISRFGKAWQKDVFIEKLLTLEWSSCFCMTEPQAGSDVGSIRTRATRQQDGSYLIEGEKIFITAGMHDLVDNLVYLVVARSTDAPQGTFGLSCFLVSRFVLEDGQPTPVENGVRATRVEKKMGLSACATTALSFGLDAPCRGYLLGEQENTALQQLASLMALARMSTGLIALGIASKAYQNAAAYAQQRLQGAGARQTFNPMAPKLAIVQHADVKRMLLEMKSKVEGCRALITKLSCHYSHLQYHDQGAHALNQDEYDVHDRWIGLLTPLVKAYVSNQAWRISELAIQVYGGHGYIRDNPVEQAARDCKILSIWEGTNFLQSAELIREKCAMGRAAPILDQAIHAMMDFLECSRARELFNAESAQLEAALNAVQAAHQAIGGYTRDRQIDHIFFNSTRFLSLLAETLITWLLLEGALIAQEKLALAEQQAIVLNEVDRNFLHGKIASLRYFAHYELPVTCANASIIAQAPVIVPDIPAAIFM